jgi:hypothetical protein
MKKTPETFSPRRFDPVASTFKHIITLNTPKGIKPLIGYSKALIGREGSDKTVVLEREILRLVNAGYLFGVTKKYGDPTVSMEFFLNGSYNGTPDESIFTLYPDEYIFSKNSDFVEDVRLNTFLKRLYTQIKEGTLVTKSLQHKPQDFTTDQLFDVSKRRFKNDQELLTWMHARIREGHPRGQVFDFYTKYCEKYFKI